MKDIKSHYFNPVSYKNVRINDEFWSPRLKVNRDSTIPYQYKQCQDTGRLEVFELKDDAARLNPHIFWDSDIAKWIEAASYSLDQEYNKDVDLLIDEVIELVASAQQSDGYLNTYYTIMDPEKRWTDLEGAHELYCAGHMIEAAVAHYDVTGKKDLLEVVCRYVDYIDTVFGSESGKMKGYPGHQEIELALVKLYRITGVERYLKLGEFFINERGASPHYFVEERKNNKRISILNEMAGDVGDQKEYNQSHRPVREQDKPVGHSVRAMYMYTAMADLAMECEDESLKKACERLWESMVSKRMYVTGGLGSTAKNEGFTYEYDLPNETSYAETCAAIGSVFWNHRMVQLDCDGKYADLLEKTLYNGVLSGISLDGKKFFYGNPLGSDGDLHRQEWFDVACCPPNIARLLASLGQYIYSTRKDTIAIHQYIQSDVSVSIGGGAVSLTQETNYPWNEDVTVTMNLDLAIEFNLKLRIPAWCPTFNVKVNGVTQKDMQADLENGYINIHRKWNDNDKVELHLEMPVQRVYSHPAVRQNVGKVALQRGPIMYCLEQVDNDKSVSSIFIPRDAELQVTNCEDLLDGIHVIKGEALSMVTDDDNLLYSNVAPKFEKCHIKAIPYYAWDNREPGKMVLWVNELETK